MSRDVESKDGEESESIHVVSADDDEDVRKILSFKLRSEGYEVTLFENGQDCWEFLLESTPPNLVILDVMMPGKDGFEVLRKMREKDKLADVPVIMLTTRGREEDIVAGFESGVDHYMSKPFSTNELLSRVRSVV